MEQIFLTYGLPKENVTVIIMLSRTTKVKVRTPDRDTDFFNIVGRVLQGHIVHTLHLFIICLDNVLRTSIDIIKENGFTLKK